MTLRSFLCRIRRDQSGSAVIEFGLIGPAMLVMIFGVLQVGIGMQAYNAMRSAAADVSRYAAVQSQKSAVQTALTLDTYAETVIDSRKYGGAGGTTSATVVEIATPRVPGTREFTLRYSYSLGNVIGLSDLDGMNVTFTSPIFISAT